MAQKIDRWSRLRRLRAEERAADPTIVETRTRLNVVLDMVPSVSLATALAQKGRARCRAARRAAALTVTLDRSGAMAPARRGSGIPLDRCLCGGVL